MRGEGSAIGTHGEGPTQGLMGQGTRGAHEEHLDHVRDLGRVEAERLVERRRGLPSRKAGMRRAVRGRGVTAAKAACTERAPTQG